MRIDHDALVMVVDGGKMLLFRNEGDADYPHLIVEAAQENVNPADQEQRTDARGRAFASVGSARSAMGETDFHDLAEEPLCRRCGRAAQSTGACEQVFERLIVVAPPTVLGEMRKHYNKALGRAWSARSRKDLTGHPVRQTSRGRSASDCKRRWRLISTFRSLFVLL